MSILTGKQVLKPYIKKTTGYIKSLLSAQHVEMNNGITLQSAVDEINNNLTTLNSYDLNVPVVIGYRNNKPVYKLIKQFPSTTYNLSINGEIKISIPEIVGKQLIGYTSNLFASYGCYMLPYASAPNRYPTTLVRHLYTTADAYASYHNNGENWANWTLEIVIYYV
ncbi:hypothetical protein NE683_02000 [Bariatricus massiliensis]|uniref:Uncharacterized protein n=1 Tax=Bariatricus massiliensis TaxID=1745713 RepID=A0ABS8DF27_9FIRM|nr:hypothetical protein [Bariatricus massiliensis]MCB7303117.1 hypothetical protein [Bariatricus massiliensis]MCB7374333.1 hypothetical protein [Bariatricus massiliensis]MCB7387003.1 hypothetical protein [Bariatricus massiliensis]MCB7411165.1 hypothetical protein [Bariatricus massiliensis]MCQ5251991.1 hypothetical protein [Bariatricus massiliensis]